MIFVLPSESSSDSILPAAGDAPPDGISHTLTEMGSRDLDQVVSYSQYQPPGAGKYDVLLLVDTHSDELAAKAIAEARQNKDASKRPKAPVVIVGFYRQSDRAHGEWFDLKWRSQPGNRRFARPNVTPDGKTDDLNSLIAERTHCAIPVNRPALVGAGRSPLVNDEPPPLYTLVCVLLPALNTLLTDEERDTFRAEGRIEKIVSRDQILATQILASVAPPARHIQRALDFLTTAKQARRIEGKDPASYAITLDNKLLRADLKQVLSLKQARAVVQSLKSPRRGRQAKARVSKEQLKLL